MHWVHVASTESFEFCISEVISFVLRPSSFLEKNGYRSVKYATLSLSISTTFNGRGFSTRYCVITPDLQDGYVGTCVPGIGNGTGDIQVGQEMLTEVLLGSYLLHLGANIQIYSRNFVLFQRKSVKRHERFAIDLKPDGS